jgi:hypothetical protein
LRIWDASSLFSEQSNQKNDDRLVNEVKHMSKPSEVVTIENEKNYNIRLNSSPVVHVKQANKRLDADSGFDDQEFMSKNSSYSSRRNGQ